MVAFFLTILLGNFPLTLDFSLWYSGVSLFAIALVLGLMVYGLVTATAGRSLFRDELDS